jgi:16S rRNA (cytosine1402-N4)-methyltransferase
MSSEHDPRHTPVLLEPVLEKLSPQAGETVADVTVGLAGHALEMARRIGVDGTLIGLDVDAGNLAVATEVLRDAPCRVILVRSNFSLLGDVLADHDVQRVDVLLADLGLSSRQLDDESRGFSFRHEGPLDMRLDDRMTTRAVDLVNSVREEELSDLIFHHSQERLSRRIAKAICHARRDDRITTTTKLSEVVCKAVGVDPESRRSKIHPATRVFQALRIVVNGELDALHALLESAPDYLNGGGRFGVIAFHSLEDGPVKRDFRRRKDEGTYEVLTKRPIIADPAERDRNPRSRSAKFRAARRTGDEGVDC